MIRGRLRAALDDTAPLDSSGRRLIFMRRFRSLGYFLRPGSHDVTLEDGQATLAFADRHLNRRWYQGKRKKANGRRRGGLN